LPTHNRSDVLKTAIQSALFQTVPDFELLVVGDGCTDDSAAVVAGFADSRIRWFDLPKAPGFGYANRNIALRQARGELIAFLAHDDIWLPDHLEVMLPLFEDSDVEIACSRPLWIDRKGTCVPLTGRLDSPRVLGNFLAMTRNLLPAGCFVHRRTCFDKYGYWDETLERDGDWELWARIIVGGQGSNLAVTRTPTNLHFRANWRSGRNAGPPELEAWYQLEKLGELPDSLTIPPGGRPEQQAYWEAIENDPAGWTAGLRASVQEAIDRMSQYAEVLAVEYQGVKILLDQQRQLVDQQRQVVDQQRQLLQLQQELLEKETAQLQEQRQDLLDARNSAVLAEEKLRDAQTELAASQSALMIAESELAAERAALLNRLMSRPRRLLATLLPPGTKRGEAYRRLLAWLTARLSQGWLS
jgi:hypothetical protein